MKTPLPVRIVAVLHGLVALFIGSVCAEGFVRIASRDPWDMQVMWVAIGLMMTGAPAWVAAGLWRGSRNAREVALTLCWVAFIGVPVRLAVFYGRESIEDECVRLVGLAVVLGVYWMLTRTAVRSWFLGCAKGDE